MAEVNLGRVKGDKGTSIRNRGSWNDVEKYINDKMFIDIVEHGGNMWMCKETNEAIEPAIDKAEWTMMVEGRGEVQFVEAGTRENIISGETIGKTFGKIRKYFSDLKEAAFNAVANNLTTTEEGSVLDARQGKELKEKIEKVEYEYQKIDGETWYKKYKDGTVEMYGRVQVTPTFPAENLVNGIHFSRAVRINLPVACVSAARISIAVNSNGIQWAKLSTSSLNKENFDTVIMQMSGVGSPINIEYIAHGRWK